MTFIDFLFTESCLYILGLFNNLDADVREGVIKKGSNLSHLPTMRRFLQNIQEQ